MKWFLLVVIRLYWRLSPKRETGRCLFRISCSRYVFQATKEQGLLKGLAALSHRFQSCRGGYHIIENAETGRKTMILCTGEALPEAEMAARFLGNGNYTE